MGIRRRRRKLTTLVSRLDSRIKTTELRSISTLSTSQIQALLDASATKAAESPDTVAPVNTISLSAPHSWLPIQDAYIYSKATTGQTTDKATFYFESDLGLSKYSDFIEISGIRGTTSLDYNVDGTWQVANVDPAPWDNRASWKHNPEQNQLPGVVITNEYSIIPSAVAPTTWSTRQRLQTYIQVNSYSVTSTTVTLTLAEAHKLVVDDIMYLDIASVAPIPYGADGIIQLTAVNGNDVSYEVFAGVETPTGSINISSSSVYLFPVGRSYVPVGSTWANSSNNAIYYWDGLRWVDYSTVANPVRDGDPPAPPTSVSVTSVGVTVTGVFVPTARVTVSWSPPSKTASDAELTDLVGYIIKYRKTISDPWLGGEPFLTNSATSYTFDSLFDQGEQYVFSIQAIDSGMQESTAVEVIHTTDVKESSLSLYAPTAPVVSVRMGTIKVLWNGLLQLTTDITGLPPSDTTFLEIHEGIAGNFTPSQDTLVSTISAYKNNFDIITGATYGTEYFYKFILKDTSGVSSPESLPSGATATPLVDTDMIASTLTAWPFQGKVIPVGSLADGSLDALSLFGDNVIRQEAIASDAITARQIVAGEVVAGKIGVDAVTANTIEAGAVEFGKIATNAVRADQIYAGSITTEKLDSEAVTTEKLDAGAVTAAKILVTDTFEYRYGGNANQKVRIGAESIPSLNITTPGIAATKNNSDWIWMASIGDQDGQIGTDFTSQNIEFFRDGTIFYSGEQHAIFTGLGTVNFYNPNGKQHGQFNLDNGQLIVDYTQPGGSSDWAFEVKSLSGFQSLWVDTSSEKKVYVKGASSTANALIVDGDVVATGYNTASSRRYKDEITATDISDALLEVPIVSFRYDLEKLPTATGAGLSEVEFGFIAEDLEDAGIPYLVQYDEEDLPSGVDYPKVAVALIPIIKRLKSKVDALEARISELENK